MINENTFICQELRFNPNDFQTLRDMGAKRPMSFC